MSVSPTPSPLPPPGSPAPTPAPGSAAEAARARGVQLGRRSLREHATRGVLISGVWMAVMGAVQTGRNLVLPAVVGPSEYGLWGALLVAGALLAAFRTTGANEIFVGQNEEDQEQAFQRVFAIEVTVNALLMVITVAVAPLLALMYGDDRLLLLGMATALAWPAQTLQAPLWMLNRTMQFGRLRLIQSVDPVIGTIVAIGLAVAGLGAWAIVLGILVGAWGTALIAIVISPYKLRPRFDREALRRYGGISVPLWLSAVTASLVSLGLMVLARWEIGLVAVGAVTLAANLTFFAQRLDQAVSTVLYPAIAAAQDKPDVLHETFGKANRVGLAWAVPVAALLVVFGPELVPLLYGDEWRDAIPVVQWFAIAIAIAHLGTNWWQYELVQGNARPMAVNGVMAIVFFVVLQIPPVLLWGLEGLAISAVAQALGQLAVRTVYVRRRFGHWSPIGLALRSLLPVLPATAAGYGLLRTDLPLGASIGTFLVLLLAGTLLFERSLVREIGGYLRGAVR